VRLAIAPTTNVVVNSARASGDAHLEVIAGSVLTFTPTNWDVPQTVTIRANVDADALDGQATFAVSSAGLADRLVTVSETDNISQIDLRIIGIQLAGTNVVVSFTSTAGSFYSLEYTDGLGTPWSTATNNIAGDGGVVQAVDLGGALHPRRFYRMKLE
jgi:cellulose 1,4-beta-cellobiosidase